MLHEFHQHAKADEKPCHATYILSGFIEERANTNPDEMQIDADDFPMSSSPPIVTQGSSRSDEPLTTTTRTVTLADENNVRGHRTLQPGSLQMYKTSSRN
jgi:hypothetical protein